MATSLGPSSCKQVLSLSVVLVASLISLPSVAADATPHRHVNGHAQPRWRADNPRWWRGHPDFAGYVGVRRGYYYAPGYGYYRVSEAYMGRVWLVGEVLPADLRRYYVVNPGFYRQAVAPAGHAWIYANRSIVLISRTTGMIVRKVSHIW